MDAHTFKTSFSSFNGGGGEHVRIQFHIKNKMKKKTLSKWNENSMAFAQKETHVYTINITVQVF